MKTPEQTIPGTISNRAWDANLTMGTQWAYKASNEKYKSATRLIEILVETRAKGGRHLLNIGPKPNGQMDNIQEATLRELAAWNFINGECLKEINPWILTNEDNIWFTWKPEEKTLYAIITNVPNWARGERKEFTLHSVKTSANTEIKVLGQSGNIVEYQPDNNATTTFEQSENGLLVSCVRAQRIYNNHKWNKPIVLKLINVEPALTPPLVETIDARISKTKNSKQLELTGKYVSNEEDTKLKVGFEYRKYAGFVEELYSNQWQQTQVVESNSEEFKLKINIQEQEEGVTYQYRAFVQHPKLRVYGDTKKVSF
jgi:alpha-L-fucosidase